MIAYFYFLAKVILCICLLYIMTLWIVDFKQNPTNRNLLKIVMMCVVIPMTVIAMSFEPSMRYTTDIKSQSITITDKPITPIRKDFKQLLQDREKEAIDKAEKDRRETIKKFNDIQP